MTRHTRPDRDRFEFVLAQEKQRASTAIEIIIVVSAGMAAGTGFVVYALMDDWKLAAGGAGVGGVLGLVYVTALAWDLARTALTRPEAEPEGGDGIPFARTTPTSTSRVPDGVDEMAVWRFLIGIASDDESITFSQRGGAEYGLTQEQTNGVKEWAVNAGFIEITNPANGHWDWTDTGERVRDLLREQPPATWNRVVREVQDG